MADENLIRLESQIAADEAETARLLQEADAEQVQAEVELAQAEAEYQAALQEVVNDQAATEEEQLAQIKAETSNDINTSYGEWRANGLQNYFNSEYASGYYDAAAEWGREYDGRKAKLARADEFQAIGLIPADATNENKLLFLASIDQKNEEKQERYDFLFAHRNPAYAIYIERHRALVKAHNAFQQKYKDDILEFRYGFNYDNRSLELRKVGGKYRMDRSKNVSIFRVFNRITPPAGDANDYIGFRWDEATKSWLEDPGGWKNTARGDPIGGQSPDIASFSRDGVWPNPHWMETEDEGHRRNFAGKSVVYAFFAGGFQRGKWNQKRAYKHCKPGYWFFETLPEEAATCVHMGGTMVDSQPSYYPASVGFEYKNTDIQNTGMEYLYQETTKNPDADVSVQGAVAAAAGQNILIPPENVNIANDYISRLIIS